MKTFEHELIICIVNEGFSDLVMDTAREVGARGGTVVNARGTANKEAEKLFRIDIQPQKEMVMIVVTKDLRDDVLHALYKEVGLNTPGQGIAIAMPVDNVVGISSGTKTDVASVTESADNDEANAQKENAADEKADISPEKVDGENNQSNPENTTGNTTGVDKE